MQIQSILWEYELREERYIIMYQDKKVISFHQNIYETEIHDEKYLPFA